MSRFIYTLAVLGAALSACRTPAPRDSGAALLHDPNAPTRGTSNWQWVKTTEDEFRDVIIPFMELGGPKQFLPADHPLTVRAQSWLDRIDGMLRERDPDALRFVPKPVAKVWKSSDPNAFVSPVPVCLDVTVRFEGKEGISQTAAKAFLPPAGGVEPPPGKRCIGRPFTPSTLGQFVAWYNLEHPSCRLTLDGPPGGEKEVVVNEGCRLGGTLDKRAGARTLVFYATAPTIVFHTGIFSIYEREEQFAAIAAHELGHYYRGHPSASEEHYNYYYRLGRHALAERPKPDESLRAFGLTVNEASRILFSEKRVAQQRYPSELFFGIWNLMLTAAGDGPTGQKACDRLTEFLAEADQEAIFGGFPHEMLTPKGLVAYREWETLVTACAPHVKLADQAQGKLSLGRETVGVELTAQDTRVGVMAQDLDDAETLADALKILADRLEEARVPARQVLEQADSEDLGYYTMEQEADELANEWLNQLGLSPKHAAEAYFAIGNWIYDHGKPLEHTAVSMPDCRKLREAGWRTENGAPYVVPIADYLDEHHTPCYRIFNIDREIKAHGFSLEDLKPLAGGAPAWSELRKVADGFAESAPKPSSKPLP